MSNLKYTKIEDIQKFLETINLHWNGKFLDAFSKDFNDLEEGVPIHVYDKDKIIGIIFICVSDTSFLVENENSEKKFDYIDYSLMWQLFMLKRKGKQYAKLLYTESLKTHEETNKQYDDKINLLIKRAEKLSHERNLKISNSNTALLNASSKLTPEEIEKINAEYSANN